LSGTTSCGRGLSPIASTYREIVQIQVELAICMHEDVRFYLTQVTTLVYDLSMEEHMTRMTRFNVYLPPELKAALDKRRHAETGVPTATFVRLCIEAGLTPSVSTLIAKMQREKAGQS